MTNLQKVYKKYNEIETKKDLNRAGLSLSDYRYIPDVLMDLQDKGFAITICRGVAKFFEKYSFVTKLDEYGFYKISM